jgi:hypothetical protein
VDCWGYGQFGQLGDGTFYRGVEDGSATPVHVLGIGEAGLLMGANTLIAGPTTDYLYPDIDNCAIMSTGEMECWGSGGFGALGGGLNYLNDLRHPSKDGVAAPVQVLS